MAIEADWDLNLFSSDPTLLGPADDDDYERAARALEQLADPRDRKSTRLNSSHSRASRMPSSA